MKRVITNSRIQFAIAVPLVMLAFNAVSRAETLPAFGVEDFRKTVAPLLKRHCLDCHGPDEQNGGVRFDRLTEGFELADQSLWTRVHEVLRAGKMPPEDALPLEPASRDRMMEWIAEQQRELKKHVGSGSRRRLNRREYARLVTQTLGIDLPQFVDELPADRHVNGFDTVAIGLQDSPDNVTVRLDAVHNLLQVVDFFEGQDRERNMVVVDAVAGDREAGRRRPQGEIGPVVQGVTHAWIVMTEDGMLLRPNVFAKHLSIQFGADEPQPDGWFRIRVTWSSAQGRGVKTHPTGVLAGEQQYVTATAEQPETFEIFLNPLLKPPARRPPGKIGGPLYSWQYLLWSSQQLPFDPSPDDQAAAKEIGQTLRGKYNAKAAELMNLPLAWLRIHRVEAEQGFHFQALDEVQRTALTADDDGALQLLAGYAQRAFRRPLDAAEWTSIERYFKQQREAGTGLDDSIRLALEVVFASPQARTLLPTDHPDAARRQYAIASRLSFGLWGAPPDDELRQLAANGSLTKPAVLREQIERLLADDRRQAFVEPFTRMWLEMDQPKRIVQKEYRHWLYQYRGAILEGMEREPAACLDIILRENLPAGQVIDSDWLPMNDAMAFHYGYPRLLGPQFRKVKVQPDDPRGGGLIGLAGLMSMTTWMGDNWPTYRGAWALRHILDDPPPPPPLDVPQLDAAEHQGKLVKERLAAHTQVQQCAVCHKKIDPLGQAFQHFGISGRWNESEHESYSAVNSFTGVTHLRTGGVSKPVDASGRLPRGESFEDWPTFKKQIVTHYVGDVVRGQLKRYLLHFCGRVPTVEDHRHIEQLLERNRQQGYPMRTLLVDFLGSPMFVGSE